MGLGLAKRVTPRKPGSGGAFVRPSTWLRGTPMRGLRRIKWPSATCFTCFAKDQRAPDPQAALCRDVPRLYFTWDRSRIGAPM